MTKVFIGGSRGISRINKAIKKRLDQIIEKQFTVVIGDANGVDKSVQNYLSDKNYANVLVFCAGKECRNNLANWSVKRVETAVSNKSFHYYAAKDLQMANEADYGFMIWDAKSRGTLNNLINLLSNNKSVLLYSAPEKKFHKLSSLSDLQKVAPRNDYKGVGGAKLAARVVPGTVAEPGLLQKGKHKRTKQLTLEDAIPVSEG